MNLINPKFFSTGEEALYDHWPFAFDLRLSYGLAIELTVGGKRNSGGLKPLGMSILRTGAA